MTDKLVNSRPSKIPKTGHFVNFIKLTSLTFSWSHYLVSRNDLLFMIKFHSTCMHNSLLFGAAAREFCRNYFQGREKRRIVRQHDTVQTGIQGRAFAFFPAWTVKNLTYAFNVSYRWRTLEINKCSILKAQLITIKYITSIMANPIIRSSPCLNSNNIATI